jgi:hypothetical protein
MIGAVRPDVDHNGPHQDSDDAYFLYTYSGGLYGNGKNRSDGRAVGTIKVGDRIGVLVDLGSSAAALPRSSGRTSQQPGSCSRARNKSSAMDTSSVRFFVNGKEFGPGFRGGVTGPLVLGVQMDEEGQMVSLMHSAKPPVFGMDLEAVIEEF